MSEKVGASHFPSFYRFSPDDAGFTCIHPCKTKDFRRCQNRVARPDKVAAIGLRKALLSLAVEEGQLVQILGQYAELCSCKRSHRNDAKELGLFREVIREWLMELDHHRSQVKGQEVGVTQKILVTKHMTELAQSLSSHSNAQDSGNYISPSPGESPLAPATTAGQPTPATPSNPSFSSFSTGGRLAFAVLGERQGQTESFESISPKKDFPRQPSDEVVLGPVTRSRAQENAESTRALSKPPRFIPYKSRLRDEDLDLAVPLPLTPAQSGNGTLYMFKRKADPGFFKLGYTTLIADDRFAWIERLCGYAPIPIRQIRHVPCIKRVERLVHIELMQYRRKNTTCLDNPDCRAVHAEWFEVDEAVAMGVMDRWVKWVVEAEPYGADGRLTKEWTQIWLNLRASSQLPTSANLLEALKNLHEQQVSRHLNVSALSVGKHLVNIFAKLEITTKCLDSKPFEQQEQAGDIQEQHQRAKIPAFEGRGSQTSSGDVSADINLHVPTSQENLPMAPAVEVGIFVPMTTQLRFRSRITPLIPVELPT